MVEELKLGLDIHGVIDSNPAFFAEMSKQWIANNHEVHIITGSPKSDKVIQELKRFNIRWTHFYSISDTLRASHAKELANSTDDNPWFPTNIWDAAKGTYCSNNKITVHYDDQLEYRDFFTTGFIHYG